jgi:intracellular multiplication protein IcmL
MSVQDAINTVLNRNNFYRDGYRLLLRICLIEAFVILILVGSLVAMVLSIRTDHVFFATTADGRIIEIVPLNQPYIGRGPLIAWAAGTTRRVMEFGYHDYRQRLQDVATNFTPNGWQSFTKALQEARILEAVEKRQLVVTTTIDAAPEIIKEGEVNGIYTWIIRMPIIVNFEGAEAPTPISSTLYLQINRISTLQNPMGVGIEQWIQKAK